MTFRFFSLILISPILSWKSNGFIGIFPTVGSVIAVFALYSTKPSLIRVLSLFSAILYLIYALVMANIGSIIGNIVNITAIV